jgi:hypothetical protein
MASITHRHKDINPAQATSRTTDIDGANWLDDHVFDSGSTGSLLVGDMGAHGQATWLQPSPTPGYVLVSTGLASIPVWGAAGGGMTNPMTALGDLIVGAEFGAPARLPRGLAGQILTTGAAGALEWQTRSLPIMQRGDLIVGNASNLPDRLVHGAVNTLLVAESDGDLAWSSIVTIDTLNVIDVLASAMVSTPLQRLVAVAGQGTPAPAHGHIYMKTADKKPFFKNDSGLEFPYFPMTGVGDMVRGGLTGLPIRVPPGMDGQVLTMLGGVPAWQAAPGFVNPMTVAGDIIVGGASGAPTKLGIGFADQVLTVVGATVQWKSLGTALVNPMTAQWDLIVGSTGGTPARLPKGTNTQVLTMVGSAIAWAPPSSVSGAMTNPMLVAGDMIIGGTAGAPTRLPPGANNLVLTMAGGVPVWLTPASAGGVMWPMLAPDGTASAPSYSFTADPNTGIRRYSEDLMALVAGGSERMFIGVNNVSIYTLDIGFSNDTLLARDGPGILAQRNGPNAQHFRLYEDVDATKYLQLSTGPGYHGIFSHSAGPLSISSDVGIYFQKPYGTNRWILTDTVFFPVENAVCDFGGSANQIRDLWLSRYLFFDGGKGYMFLTGPEGDKGFQFVDQRGSSMLFQSAPTISTFTIIPAASIGGYFQFGLNSSSAASVITAPRFSFTSTTAPGIGSNFAVNMASTVVPIGGVGLEVMDYTALQGISLQCGPSAAMHMSTIASAPATPYTNFLALYAKADKQLYIKDDAGLETRLTFLSGGNLPLFGGAVGINGLGVIALGVGTAPTTSPVNTVQMWAGDVNGEAGSGGLFVRDERGGRSSFGSLTADYTYLQLAPKAGSNTIDVGVWTNGARIFVSGNVPLQLGTNFVSRWSIQSVGHFFPDATNTYDIGAVGFRVKGVYAGNVNLSVHPANRVMFTASDGWLMTHANLTFDGYTLHSAGDITAGGNIGVTGTSYLAAINGASLNLGGGSINCGILSSSSYASLATGLHLPFLIGNGVLYKAGDWTNASGSFTTDGTNVTILGRLGVGGVGEAATSFAVFGNPGYIHTMFVHSHGAGGGYGFVVDHGNNTGSSVVLLARTSTGIQKFQVSDHPTDAVSVLIGGIMRALLPGAPNSGGSGYRAVVVGN